MTQVVRSYQDLSDLLARHVATMPDAYRKIAACVLDNHQQAAFMTASELSRFANVSQATVTRFATSLGFESYQHFLKALQTVIRMELKGTDRMHLSANRDEAKTSRYHRLLQQEAEHIFRLQETVETPAFQQAATAITQARQVYVAGHRTATALATYMTCFLAKIHPGVTQLSQPGSLVYDQLVHADPTDTVLVATVFPRYPRESLELLAYAKDRGFRVICLTDSVISSTARWADELLVAPINLGAVFDSYAAPMALINMLIDAVGRADAERSQQRLALLEEMYAQRHVHEMEDRREIPGVMTERGFAGRPAQGTAQGEVGAEGAATATGEGAATSEEAATAEED